MINNLKINQYHDDIWEIENFLTQEEVNLFLNVIDRCPEVEWNEQYNHLKINNKYNQQFSDDLSNIKKIENKIEKLFNDVVDIVRIDSIRRHKVGEFMRSHQDINSYVDEPITFGIVLYLNNNYSGGKIYYKDLDLSIQPKANSMLIHGAQHFHEILPVESGVRYSLTLFIIGKEAKFNSK